jgi:putative ABC transport system ATP-binding protein
MNKPEYSAYPHENNYMIPAGADFIVESVEEVNLPHYGHIKCHIISLTQVNDHDLSSETASETGLMSIRSSELDEKAGLFEDLEENPEIIRVTNVHKTYLLGIDGAPALRGVDLAVKEGEFITILGNSGGGKTSLLNIMGTIDKPSKGDLYICGVKVMYNTKDEILANIRLNKLGFVFQSFNLIGSLTALENVMLPMQLKGIMTKTEIFQRAKKLLNEVGLTNRQDHFPPMLSGGEQ